MRRVGIGIVVAAIGVGAVFYAPAFALLATAIALGSLWEFDQLSARKGSTIVLPIAAAAVVAYLALTALGLIHRYEGVLLGATVIGALAYATFGTRENYLARSAYTLLAVLYIGKLLSYFVTIRNVPSLGFWLTLDAIFIIAMTDIFAMLVGVSIGRTPLTKLSPKKTVEGAIGGFLAGVAIGAVFGSLPQLHIGWWQGALVGAITSLAAQIGDLVESALKRDARVKDAGSAIGSHGGVLDRFDSYLFGGPAFYFALWLLGFVHGGALS